MSKELHGSINEILSKSKKLSPQRHSFFQLQFFVIGKEPTTQAKLKRCVDELRVRKQSIDNALLEIEEINDQMALINIDILANENESLDKVIISKRIAGRKVASLQNRIVEIKEKIESLEEECLFFVQSYDRLIRIEDHKSWDSAEVQLEYWTTKLDQEVKIRQKHNYPIDLEVAKTIESLPIKKIEGK